MNNDLNFFMSFMEADDPPDAAMAASNSPPPDVPDDSGTSPDDIPDMGDSDGSPPDFGGDESAMDDGGAGDSPPDFGDDDSFDDGSGENDENSDEENKKEPMDLDEKVSAIMNANLYTRFLSMLTNLGAQMSQMKSNADIIYTLSPDATELYNKYKQLDDNIRLYLNNSFIDENYSKNLLFFNKCLNLLKLLNDSFSSYVNKGIREQK